MADLEYTEKKKPSSKKLLLIFLVLLLLFNTFLVIILLKKNQEKSDQLVSTNALKEQLAKEIKDYEAQVALYKNQLGDKDTLLAQSRREIDSMKTRIENLIKSGRITKDKYEKALEELEILRYYTKKYQAQIEELKLENTKLSSENQGLKNDIKTKGKEIDKLTDQNVLLNNKVTLGAMLKTNTINVMGIQAKTGSKERETLKGSRMEGLKVSFTLKDNMMSTKGPKEFIVKVINPKGETLWIEERGSGKFTYQNTESLYTVKDVLDFNNDASAIYTLYWAKGSPFEKGTYKAQVFNDNMLIGENTFEVK